MKSTNSPYIIGICGGSGSGKTRILTELQSEFSKAELCIISMDEYYHPRESQITDAKGVKNFDLPTSIDYLSLVDDINSLMRQQVVKRREYIFNNRLAESKIVTYNPAPIYVIEGLFVMHYEEIRKILDLRIFIHAKDDIKVIRRIKRDQKQRNYPVNDVLYRYENHVTPAFEKYIKPYLDEADLVIINNKNYENGLEVLKGFLKEKLRVT